MWRSTLGNPHAIKFGQARPARLAALLSGAALSVLAPAATAQTASADAPQATAKAPVSVEEVVVTGTNIRGVAPVGAPLVQIGREDVRVSTAVSLSDLLLAVPQVQQIGINESNRGAENGSQNRTYSASLNLRGLDPGDTLTLINGHRVTGQGPFSTFHDPSIVPTIALQRVEIVADGSSAIYGSDAIAGVVNLIPRTNFNGAEIKVTAGFSDHYNPSQIGLIFGRSYDRAAFMVSFEHSQHDILLYKDRPFTRADQTAKGGTNFAIAGKVFGRTPSVVQSGSTFYAVGANNTIGTAFSGNPPACDLTGNQVIAPSQKKDGGFATWRYDLTDNLKASGDAFYYHRAYNWDEFLGQQTYTYTSTSNPRGFPLPAGTSTATVLYNGAGLTNNRVFVSHSYDEAYGASARLTYQLPHDWKVTGGLNASKNKDVGQTLHGVNTAALTNAINTGIFSPFQPTLLTSAQLAPLTDTQFRVPGQSQEYEASGSVDGPVFRLPGGDAKLAVGGAYRRDMVRQYNLVNAPVGFEGQPGQPATPQAPITSRDHVDDKSAYVELFVPVVGPDNAVPLVRSLDIDIAGRYDSYATVVSAVVPGASSLAKNVDSSTTNPKVGVNWSPAEGVIVRASYGTSFQAPGPTAYVPATGRRILIQSRVLPNGAQTEAAFINDSPDTLTAETSKTYSFGVEFQPSYIAGFKGSLSYWHIRIPNAFGTPGLNTQNILSQAALYPGLIILNPTQAQLNALMAPLGRFCTNQSGLYHEPIPNCFGAGGTLAAPTTGNIFDPTHITAIVNSRNANLAVITAAGIDFDAREAFPTTRIGRFVASVNGTYMTDYIVQASGSSPAVSQLDTLGNPIRLRIRGLLLWTYGDVLASVGSNYTGGYINSTPLPGQTSPQKIKSYTTIDLNIAYKVSSRGWAENTELGVNVSNLLDKDPPFVNVGGVGSVVGEGYDAEQASAIGRVVSVYIDKKF